MAPESVHTPTEVPRSRLLASSLRFSMYGDFRHLLSLAATGSTDELQSQAANQRNHVNSRENRQCAGAGSILGQQSEQRDPADGHQVPTNLSSEKLRKVGEKIHFKF